MLPGVDEGDRDLFRPVPANRIELADSIDDWRRLHEVGARANDDEDLHTKIIPLISGLGQLIFRYTNLRNNRPDVLVTRSSFSVAEEDLRPRDEKRVRASARSPRLCVQTWAHPPAT